MPLFSSILLPGWMATFNAIHPDVHIQARSGMTEEIEAGIISGAFDLGFCMLPVEHSEINIRELFTTEVVMVASKKHPMASKKKLEPADLNQLPVAMPSHRTAIAQLMHSYFNEHGVQPRLVVEYDDGHALVKMAKKGDLVTFLPRSGIEDPSLCLLHLPPPGLRLTAVALWTHHTPASQAFLEIATEAAKSIG